jgi:SAM-dependent methyltransferase
LDAALRSVRLRFFCLYTPRFRREYGKSDLALLLMAEHLNLVPASNWVTRWERLVMPSQAILDVACGAGRHTRFFIEKGCAVTALDVSGEALQTVLAHSPTARVVQADIENAPWPLQGETFDAVVVTHYLWRPLFPKLLASLKDGGILMYETFAVGNEAYGKPSRADFLLKSKELLSLCADLHVIAYEEGFLAAPNRLVQRIVAVNRNGKMPVLLEPTQFHL